MASWCSACSPRLRVLCCRPSLDETLHQRGVGAANLFSALLVGWIPILDEQRAGAELALPDC